MKTRSYVSRLLLPIFLLFFSGVAMAQWPDQCVDSTRVNPFFNCGPEYYPVCGCDGVTYRNECSARNNGGLIGTMTNGVCSEFEFDIIPNILDQSIGYFKLTIVSRERANFIIIIMDLYGKMEFSYSVANTDRFDFQLDPYVFRHGLHFIAVISNGERKVKRFVKMPEQ